MAAAAAAPGPKYYLLNYTYVPDIVEKRGPFREAHLAGAKKHLDAGRLVAAGAVGDPVEGATFFFKDITKVRQYVAADHHSLNRSALSNGYSNGVAAT
jgi:uncharacterized protein YciI